MVWRLTEDPALFPDPTTGEEDGLLAVGGDLSPLRLLNAYNLGIFPWYSFKDCPEILWWCPMDRFVIFPKEIHISHSMRQLMRKGTYAITWNKCFEEVIKNCGQTDNRNKLEGAWLGTKMTEAYTELHRLGFAASVEVWNGNRLVGGLYGVRLGRNFFGESMFSLVPGASKLALITLARLMEDSGGIIDCQFETDHLKSMGGRHITYTEYLKYLHADRKS